MAKAATTQKQKDAISKRKSIKKAVKAKELATKQRLAAEEAEAKKKAKAAPKVVKDGKDVEEGEAPLEVFTDEARHVALRYQEGDTWTEAVVIGEGGGLDILRVHNREFAHRFCNPGALGSKDVYQAAEKLLAVANRAVAPCSDRAVAILKEIVMAAKAKKKVSKKSLKKVSATAAAKPVKEGSKPRGSGIGTMVCDMLLKKKDTEEIIAAVKKANPDAKTSPASVAWYRNKLREEGKLPKS